MDVENSGKKRVFDRLGTSSKPTNHHTQGPQAKVCFHWQAGRCSRRPCPFLHGDPASSSSGSFNGGEGGATTSSKRPHILGGGADEGSAMRKKPNFNNTRGRGEGATSNGFRGDVVTRKDKLCNFWIQGNCNFGDKCRYLHSSLEGHQKGVTGIALLSGSDKLYTGDQDETMRIWDCQSGQMVGSSQATGKEKEKALAWTDSLCFNFLSVIKVFLGKNGYSTSFDWPILLDEFERKTGKHVSIEVAKNKFNHLKKKWSSWNHLRYRITSAGWDHETGLITAGDAWWELHKGDEFYQFKKKAPSLEMSDLWDDVFGQIAVTGKHVVVPSMDPGSVPAYRNEGDEAYFVGDDEVNLGDSLERDALLDNTQQSQQVISVQSKRKSRTTTSQGVDKRRRKLGPAVAAYQDNLPLVRKTSKQMLSLMKGDLGSANSANQKTEEFKDAFKELMRLVTDEKMVRQSPVWCYAVTELSKDERRQIFMVIAVTELSKDERRQIFMVIEDDADKVAWLNHEYEMMRLHLSK